MAESTVLDAPKRKRGAPRKPEHLKFKDNPNRDHTLNVGKRIDPRRIDRAEDLFCGLGPEGAPLPIRKIQKLLAEEFSVSEAQANVYIRCVKDRLKERFACFDPEAAIEQSDDMFLAAFEMAKRNDDAHAMVAATHRRAELRGIFQRKTQLTAQVAGIGELFATVFSDVPQEPFNGTVVVEPELEISRADT